MTTTGFIGLGNIGAAMAKCLPAESLWVHDVRAEAMTSLIEQGARAGSLTDLASPAGAGTQCKLARNLLTFAGFAVAAEASRLAEAAGIDIRKLAAVVRHSDAITGGPGAIMVRASTAELDPADDLRPIFEHTRTLGEKDLTLALAMGEALGLDLPFAALARRTLAADLGVPHKEAQ